MYFCKLKFYKIELVWEGGVLCLIVWVLIYAFIKRNSFGQILRKKAKDKKKKKKGGYNKCVFDWIWHFLPLAFIKA